MGFCWEIISPSPKFWQINCKYCETLILIHLKRIYLDSALVHVWSSRPLRILDQKKLERFIVRTIYILFSLFSNCSFPSWADKHKKKRKKKTFHFHEWISCKFSRNVITKERKQNIEYWASCFVYAEHWIFNIEYSIFAWRYNYS